MDSAQAKQLSDGLLGKRVGDWLIDEFLGNGKSAVVLRADNNGVQAAIKIFHPELIERYGKAVQLERIKRERSLIGAEHPNLVRILDGGECDSTGYLYVVMELLPYRNLHQCLKDLPLEVIPKLNCASGIGCSFLGGS